MTHTLAASARNEVLIGEDQPFCVIGERINPSGKPQLATAMTAGDFAVVQAQALRQVEAGAAILDVNAGVPSKAGIDDEAALMASIVGAVQAVADVPLSIDSAHPATLAAGLEACSGRPLLNSVSGEEERLELLLPLARKHGVALVALCHDGTGISEDMEARFAIAKKIVERAADHGIPVHDVIVDPLVVPEGVRDSAGARLFPLIRRLGEELKINTICGASNISFGHGGRARRNAAFLKRAIENGLTAAIMNPLSQPEMDGVRACATSTGSSFPLDTKTG